MILEILTPIFFFLLLFWIIGSKYFFQSKTISKQILLLGFTLKALSALLFGYFFKTGILTGGDTYLYFNDSAVVYNTLFTDPMIFLKLLIGSNDYTPVPQAIAPYTDKMHFWFDSSNYFMVRVNAFLRIFSLGVYNVHAILFAFLSFIGTYNLYLFFEEKVFSKRVLQFILFGIPSIVFWTSGVHKEAIVIFALGIILYNLDRMLRASFTRRNVLYAIIGLVVLAYIRAYLLAFLLPLMTSVIIYSRMETKQPTVRTFAVAIAFFAGLALFIDYSTPNISFTNEFLTRRSYFLNTLPGNMTFDVPKTPANLQELALLLVEAIVNPFIRPLPSDCNVFLSYLAALETVLLLFVIVTLLITTRIKNISQNPYAIFSILFGLSILFFIGLIVNNSGAIVRYRSIAIPFILIGLCLSKKESHKKVKFSS